MRHAARALILAAALGTALAGFIPASAQAGTARITFVAPQNYTDGNLGWAPVDQRLTLEGLTRIIERLAATRLPPGDTLEVSVLNLDLAGMINPLASRTGTLRVMREDTWPSIKLAYTLRRDGRVLARGEETIRSLNYLMDPVAVRSVDPLRFEKALLTRWFTTTLRPYLATGAQG
ncbi:DUF3016 domain-containing protein [Ancylobacter sp. WKF20]|uniref:DUF3016 domain-containing protein n=1 Tax=Ancylobacter sp. WKF20 TaxID=3039801 RepID=UPI00243423A4|nr:DUF3016 domain-containing protein [Ancylobacter sp. WKF20]WGD29886.1 DUF3016 domain-containing protein [Ancylobacter sp. WKF20]